MHEIVGRKTLAILNALERGTPSASVSNDLLDGQCCANKFHPTKSRCQNLAKWKGKGTGNFTDEWKWCDEHAPDEPFREAI
ncbi:MAG: hypothetical protein ABIL06_23040 [Pseudomonadota bacterium]